VAAATKRDEVLRPVLQKLAGQSLRAIAAERPPRHQELERQALERGLGQECDVRLGFRTTGRAS
jgi:hypothetical protein